MSHTHRGSSVLKTIKKEFGFLAALILVAGIVSIGSHTSKPFASAEVQFSDSSHSGLSIVPASCPSNPHVAGECSAPAVSSITISPTPIFANNANLYTITETSNDANGGATIQDNLVLINYITNTPNYRGYIAWSSDSFAWNFGGVANMKEPKTCTGGGQAGIADTGYGYPYLDLQSCSTSVSGTTRISTFVVTFSPTFTTPITNYLDGYVYDNTGTGAPAWLEFNNFSLVTCPAGQTWNGSACVAPTPTCALGASPTSIVGGQSSTLTWSSTNGSTFSINQSIGAKPLSGTVSVSPAATITYTGTVTNATGQTATCPATVTVGACPAGQHWGGSSCIPYVCTGTVPTNSTICTGDDTGLVADTAITVAAVCGAPKCEYSCNGGFVKSGNTCVALPTCSLGAAPTSIGAGGSSVLTWSTTNGSTFSINQGIGAKALSGTQSVTPAATLTYTGTVTSATGQTATCPATVTVTTCTGGQTWNGSVCACPANTSWNGSACVPPAPTGLSFTCNAAATQATVSWTNAPGVTKNNIDVDHTANPWTGACPAVNAGDVCVTNVTGVPPYVINIIPTNTYTTWVFAGNANGTGAQSTNLSVTCTCPAGQSLSGNVCACPAGQTWDGNSCVSQCTGGQTWNGTSCVCTAGTSCNCPAGQTWNGTSCVSFCTGGQTWNGAACACPAGQSWNGTSCTGSCTDSFFCQGSNLMHQSTTCVDTLSQSCSYGCSSGTCLSAPTATIDFSVTPLLVRKTENVQVTWTTGNTTACNVTSTNGASWSGTSGTQTSPAIQAQTIFTIQCTSTAGATVTQSSTVNIIPVFCEPGTAGC